MPNRRPGSTRREEDEPAGWVVNGEDVTLGGLALPQPYRYHCINEAKSDCTLHDATRALIKDDM
jgi:hypothetical protein